MAAITDLSIPAAQDVEKSAAALYFVLLVSVLRVDGDLDSYLRRGLDRYDTQHCAIRICTPNYRDMLMLQLLTRR